jgi:hypothetical protein
MVDQISSMARSFAYSPTSLQNMRIMAEWRFYSETVKRILPGDTARLREASARLGYPLMNAVPGLVSRIDDLDRWLQAERDLATLLTKQLADTQKEVSRLNLQAAESASHSKVLEKQKR